MSDLDENANINDIITIKRYLTEDSSNLKVIESFVKQFKKKVDAKSTTLVIINSRDIEMKTLVELNKTNSFLKFIAVDDYKKTEFINIEEVTQLKNLISKFKNYD